MKADTANRSFAGLLGASLLGAMLVFCGAVGCVLVALLATRLADDGLGALSDDGLALWAAIAFIAIVGAGAVAGAMSLLRQVAATRRLAQRLSALELPLSPELAGAADRSHLRGRVQLVDSSERFSFAYGAMTPRVVVSRGLQEAASTSELDAVLEHERYHVRNLDPLKVLLARALPRTFFYVPALGGLESRYVAGRELAADRRAVESCGREPLAGALLKAVRGPQWPELEVAAAIGGPELLDLRIAQLESGSEPQVAPLTRGVLALSLLGAALLTAIFIASVVAYGGPSAVADATGASITVLDAAGAVLCAAPWAAGLWLGYRWISRRSSRPLDTTPS